MRTRRSPMLSAAFVCGLAACTGAGRIDEPGVVVDAAAPLPVDAMSPVVPDAPPFLVENEPGGIGGYDVVVDSAGNATLAWQQADGDRGDIWSRRWIEGVGWDAAVRVEADDVGSADIPHLAVDAAGAVTAVWLQSDRVQANRFVPGVGWGAAQPIDVGGGQVLELNGVAIDAAGAAVALWRQADGDVERLWIARFVAGTGWGAPQLVDVGAAVHPRYETLALDAHGDATVTWTQLDGDHEDLWANRFVPGEGWGTPALVENIGGYAGPAALAVAPDGAVTALWTQRTGTAIYIHSAYSVWANRFVPGVGWGAAVQLANVGRAEDVAVDGTGATIAVWTRDVPLMADNSAYAIWTSRLVPGAGWTAADEIGGGIWSAAPRLAVDVAGVVTMLWSDHWDDYQRAKRYVPDVGWSAEVLHPDHPTPEGMFYPLGAIGASGRTVIAWRSNEGNLWAYVVH